jgi:hypothetical protein
VLIWGSGLRLTPLAVATELRTLADRVEEGKVTYFAVNWTGHEGFSFLEKVRSGWRSFLDRFRKGQLRLLDRSPFVPPSGKPYRFGDLTRAMSAPTGPSAVVTSGEIVPVEEETDELTDFMGEMEAMFAELNEELVEEDLPEVPTLQQVGSIEEAVQRYLELN